MHQKLVPDPFLILLYHLKQPLHTRSSFKNKKFWKRIIKKKVNFIFRTQSLLIYKIIKNKRVLEPVNIHSSGYEKSSEKFLCYVLSDQVWWCNVKQFLSYSKKTFEPGNCERKVKNYKNLNILRTKRAF